MQRAVSISLYLCLCWSPSAVPQGLALDASPVPDPTTARPTDLGRYRVAWSSALQPLAINRMHAWVIHIASADGDPVEGAILEVSGGMPLPRSRAPHGTADATADLGEGNYRVDGMKFHMSGAWEVVIDIEAAAGADSLTLLLEL